MTTASAPETGVIQGVKAVLEDAGMSAGDLDIPLPEGTGDACFLNTLDDALARLLPLSSVDIVFYLAGADPFAEDRFGRLDVSKDGLASRLATLQLDDS